jgi:hypothetical protein
MSNIRLFNAPLNKSHAHQAPTGVGSSQQLQLMNSSQPGLGYSEFFP